MLEALGIDLILIGLRGKRLREMGQVLPAKVSSILNVV